MPDDWIEQLRELTSVEHRVDWPLLRERISAAVAERGRRSPARTWWRRLAPLGMALAGAAAVLLVMLALPIDRVGKPSGVAVVHVSAPGGTSPIAARAGVATVRVCAPPGANKPDNAEPSTATPRQLAEVFLMIEPAPAANHALGGLSPIGIN